MSGEITSGDVGGAEAFVRQLHADHGSALLGWATRRFADRRDAEEVVAETLAKAWRSYDRFDPALGTERAWLFAILRNTATDHHRGSARRLHLVADVELTEDGEDSGDDIDRVAETTVIREALMDLSERHREVIVEAYFAGRTVVQISRHLSLPVGTVKSRLFYGLRRLRALLREVEREGSGRR